MVVAFPFIGGRSLAAPTNISADGRLLSAWLADRLVAAFSLMLLERWITVVILRFPASTIVAHHPSPDLPLNRQQDARCTPASRFGFSSHEPTSELQSLFRISSACSSLTNT